MGWELEIYWDILKKKVIYVVNNIDVIYFYIGKKLIYFYCKEDYYISILNKCN